jgi:hypothetical protein
MYHMSLLWSLVRCRVTYSINIPRLRRSGIREFDNGIPVTEGTRPSQSEQYLYAVIEMRPKRCPSSEVTAIFPSERRVMNAG